MRDSVVSSGVARMLKPFVALMSLVMLLVGCHDRPNTSETELQFWMKEQAALGNHAPTRLSVTAELAGSRSEPTLRFRLVNISTEPLSSTRANCLGATSRKMGLSCLQFHLMAGRLMVFPSLLTTGLIWSGFHPANRLRVNIKSHGGSWEIGHSSTKPCCFGRGHSRNS